jgi:hypothetical protein
LNAVSLNCFYVVGLVVAVGGGASCTAGPDQTVKTIIGVAPVARACRAIGDVGLHHPAISANVAAPAEDGRGTIVGVDIGVEEKATVGIILIDRLLGPAESGFGRYCFECANKVGNDAFDLVPFARA